MPKQKKPASVDPLFAGMPPSVISLAHQAAKGIRKDERAKWWAANKPTS
jgi:hypothetical protein